MKPLREEMVPFRCWACGGWATMRPFCHYFHEDFMPAGAMVISRGYCEDCVRASRAMEGHEFFLSIKSDIPDSGYENIFEMIGVAGWQVKQCISFLWAWSAAEHSECPKRRRAVSKAVHELVEVSRRFPWNIYSVPEEVRVAELMKFVGTRYSKYAKDKFPF